MSDLSEIHFRNFITKRKDLKDDMQVKEFNSKIETLAKLMFAANGLINVSSQVNELLSILHESAMRNKDFHAIAQTEVICKQIMKDIFK